MKIAEVTTYLDEVMQPELQEDYDNSGFLFGNSQADYTGALVALDLTPAVVEEARTEGMNLIVTHHPFIFGGLKRITDATESGRMALEMARAGICVYAAHTNLDNLPWGVNAALAKRLGLTDCRILRPMPGARAADGREVGAGMIGLLAEMEDAAAFVERTKRLLGLPVVRTSATTRKKSIRRVAICGGSGAPFINDALRAGADVYLTGDLKYHDFQRTDGRMLLVDIGHYESEQYAKDVIFSVLSEKFSNFACRISAAQQSIVGYM